MGQRMRANCAWETPRSSNRRSNWRRFEIEPMRDLSFPDGDGRRILEPGEIILTAGGQSASFHVRP